MKGKTLMKMNFKVRFKNPVFWATFFPAVVTFIYSMLGCFGIAVPLSEDTVTQIILSIVSALTTIGVLVDPTTKGVRDSDRAMEYSDPN
jgi:phi LC3 family holin